jgi:MFS family permease
LVVFPFAFHIAVQQPFKPLWSRLLLYELEPSRALTCYFEKKRSLVTGIAVCGSGLGTFVFAPLTGYLIVEYGWRGAMLIIAGFVLSCAFFGVLFRPVPGVRESKSVSRKASASSMTHQATSASTDLHDKKDIFEGACNK